MIPPAGFETSLALLPLAGIGILVNLVYIWITTKTNERRVLTDASIISACVAYTLSSVQLFMRSVLSLQGRMAHSDTFVVFDTAAFLLDGLYLWSHLILNTFRFIVLKDLHTPQNRKSRTDQSNRCLLVAVVFVLLSSIGYGIQMGTLTVTYTENVPITIQIFHGIVIEIPYCFIVCFSTVVLFKLFNASWNTRIAVGVSITPPSDTVRRADMMRQFLKLLVFQLFFFVIPAAFVYWVELRAVHTLLQNEIEQTTIDLFWITKILLVIFNPLTFGILLQPRRKFLGSFLDVKKISKAWRSRNTNTNTHEREVTLSTVSEPTSQGRHSHAENVVINAIFLPEQSRSINIIPCVLVRESRMEEDAIPGVIRSFRRQSNTLSLKLSVTSASSASTCYIPITRRPSMTSNTTPKTSTNSKRRQRRSISFFTSSDSSSCKTYDYESDHSDMLSFF
ncbi:unnamed protein product [Mytilus coruscus]|uniref:Uncharacterized protein n=1 Tax=Mytilus coruscus TaxID=42192 RepID=A0A6J8EJG1_MYTCO|nr:unnamed protein product [Mytilus coruscus]